MPKPQIWKNCTMDSYGADGLTLFDCVVRFNGDEIRVEYGEDGTQAYRGHLEGPGHYRLTAPELNGRADLHMFDDERVLVGSWVQGQAEGMWKIQLSD